MNALPAPAGPCAGHAARLEAVRPLTPTVDLYRLRPCGAAFRFQAGQWVELCAQAGGERLCGAFSITSPPQRSRTIELAIRRNETHPLVRHLAAAPPGRALCLGAPRGRLGAAALAPGPLVLLAAGTGIAPMMSILGDQAARGWPRPVHLLYSARTSEDLAFAREIEAMAAHNPRLQVLFSLTRRAPAGWTGARERIGPRLLRRLDLPPEAHYALCGPPAMVDDVAAALARLGVPPARVHYDRWW